MKPHSEHVRQHAHSDPREIDERLRRQHVQHIERCIGYALGLVAALTIILVAVRIVKCFVTL